MKRIKREYSFRTTDGTLHSGKKAEKKAIEPQKSIDFKKTIKDVIPEMGKIFNLRDLCDYGDTDEAALVDKINETLFYECDDFYGLIRRLVNIYLEVPEIVECFQLIKCRFENHK